ncbi:hypothetical protein MGYG_09202 [Nannizzia gypsea CBS 118893]|uniref:DUF676 domain-containing protein n=1 Tax=Arthroderma gypseum (strain ATCC MYA-4604 / CBS 118893) TaxID=535722 RepID=E4V6N7_ARTGP|nr:hypothetical protein MGYG_09202 [Nannizzia gypsea CBS 118893]EFQ96753.1 hypothetical protein MGYG_09202 [Nannizzia gypsea CBS 118893]
MKIRKYIASLLNSKQPVPETKSQEEQKIFPDGLKVLHKCDDALVDICFVHGLAAFLPSRLERARILTYGYDAHVVRLSVASTNRLIDHATNLLHDLADDRASSKASSRPVIFVAHSIGGIVCKRSLLLSRHNRDPHIRTIFDSTKGIIFMGTPHTGTWMADWAKIPADALGIVKSTNKSLLEILQTDSQLLENIQADFLFMVGDLPDDRQFRVACFFEELPLSTFGLVVTKSSATFAGYNPISIHANHHDMVKFKSTEENGFKRVLGQLTRWIDEIRLTHQASEPFSTIPFSRDENFVGRGTVMAEIESIFEKAAPTHHTRVALVGIGGIGKSQIAIEYAHRMQERDPNLSVHWVYASNTARFEQAYRELADRLDLPGRLDPTADIFQVVFRWLSDAKNGKWLIVLDNADDDDIFFQTAGKRNLLTLSPRAQIAPLSSRRAIDSSEEYHRHAQ